MKMSRSYYYLMVSLLLQECLFHISDRTLGVQMLLCADQPVLKLFQLALELFSLKNTKEIACNFSEAEIPNRFSTANAVQQSDHTEKKRSNTRSSASARRFSFSALRFSTFSHLVVRSINCDWRWVVSSSERSSMSAAALRTAATVEALRRRSCWNTYEQKRDFHKFLLNWNQTSSKFHIIDTSTLSTVPLTPVLA